MITLKDNPEVYRSLVTTVHVSIKTSKDYEKRILELESRIKNLREGVKSEQALQDEIKQLIGVEEYKRVIYGV